MIIKKFRLLQIIPLVLLLISLNSCFQREGTEDEPLEEGLGEVEFSMSGGLNGFFLSDSVEVIIDDLGASGLWILILNAYQNLPEYRNFSLTAIGISFPGDLFIDYSGNFGGAYLNNANINFYDSNVPGGWGMVEVTDFVEEVSIAGIFNFCLIDTLTGDTLTISDGRFDAQIDQSLYINP